MTVTLSAEQFNTLGRLVQVVDLIKLRAERELQLAAQKRDAYYTELVRLHGLPQTCTSMVLHEDTLVLEVTTQEG